MKTPEQRQKAKENADRIQEEHLSGTGAFTDWFEDLYAGANGDSGMVPWANEEPHAALVDWTKSNPPKAARRAIDVGCGIGDNAEHLAQEGWAVTAIDLSPSAIEWAIKRHEGTPVTYRRANLLDLPEDLAGSFDFIHETYTLQSVPKEIRRGLFEAIARLAAPEGRLLLVCIAREEDVAPDGPPWALAKSEVDLFLDLGFQEISFESFELTKPDGRIIPHFRIEYQKNAAG